jgi:hypothetical protein
VTSLLAGLVGMGVAAACGTTVPTSSWPVVSAQGTSSLTDGLGGPTTQPRPALPSTGASQTGVPDLVEPTAATRATGSASKSHRAAGTAGTASAGPATPAAIAGSGPIKLGLAYVDSGASNTVLSGIGKGLASADTHGEVAAYVAHINSLGGVLGRKLEMVFYRASPNDSLQSIGQGICATETQDHHVDISFDSNYGDVVFPCLNRARVPTIFPGIDGLTTASYKSFPLVTEPDSVAIDRLASIEVPQLVKMGYKPTGLQKLGVLYFNGANFVAGFNALKAAWAARGVKIAASVALSNWNSVGEIAGLLTSVQSAELRFRAQGVTHVMCVETNAFICGFFGLVAASQGYFPRYAFTSDQPLTNILANVPAKGLKGSVFVGWNPPQDLSRLSSMPRGVRSCWAFMNKHGFPTSTGNERDGAASICEAVDYAVATLKAAGSTDPDAIVAAARSIGPSFETRRVLGVGTGQAGVAVVRRGSFQEGCSCFVYTSPPINVK